MTHPTNLSGYTPIRHALSPAPWQPVLVEDPKPHVSLLITGKVYGMTVSRTGFDVNRRVTLEDQR